MKTITSLTVLMQLAHKVGQAKKDKNPDAIKKAQEALENYKKIILNKDTTLSLNIPNGALY